MFTSHFLAPSLFQNTKQIRRGFVALHKQVPVEARVAITENVGQIHAIARGSLKKLSKLLKHNWGF